MEFRWLPLSRTPRRRRHELPSFPRRRSHSLKGEFRSARILKGPSVSSDAPLRAGNLKVHSRAFRQRLQRDSLCSATQEKWNYLRRRSCDLNIPENASTRRKLRRQEYLAWIKSFSRAIIARIQNLRATLARQANDKTDGDLTKLNIFMTIKMILSCTKIFTSVILFFKESKRCHKVVIFKNKKRFSLSREFRYPWSTNISFPNLIIRGSGRIFFPRIP